MDKLQIWRISEREFQDIDALNKLELNSFGNIVLVDRPATESFE